MSVIIDPIDSSDVKKYIRQRSKPDGHDCWGKTEWTYWNVVVVDGEDESIHHGQYIAHDGEKVITTGFIDHLPKSISMYMDPSIREREKERRYKSYLTLKREFEVDSEENKKVKREVNIEEIIKT